MGTRVFLQLILQRQLVFGISYAYETYCIGFFVFNIHIDCSKFEKEFFRFTNNWNK